MESKSFFKDNFKELQFLFKKKKPFVLFLGAGINGDFDKMLWNDLLNYLLTNSLNILSLEEGKTSNEKKKIMEIISSPEGKFNTYSKAMFIKKVLGENYISYLQSYLYCNCNIDVIKEKIKKREETKETIFLFEIAELILRNKNIHAVVTYNYDNFLTESIRLLQKNTEKKIEGVDIYRTIQQSSLGKGKFPIYHVHGFIPPPDGTIIQEPENVVLSIDEYFNNMIEPFSWQTTTQLHFLNNYNCLFLGTSLDDWNMLRALSYSNHFSKATSHFVIYTNEHYNKGASVATFMNRVKASVLEDMGIKTIYTETDNFEEIHQKINHL